MRSAEIQKQLKTQPFVPFRVCMSDGEKYDVRHPEMIIVTHTILSVAIFGGDANMPEYALLLDPLQVTRLEPINGQTVRS